MPIPTEAEFVTLINDVQAQIVAILRPRVEPQAKVESRYMYNRSEENWAGMLRSSADQDRVHAWMVSFAGFGDSESSVTGSTEPQLPFIIDAFWSFEYGTNAENSEARARAEVARVFWAFAKLKHLGLPNKIRTHSGFKMKLQLGGIGAQLAHKGFGELLVTLQPIRTR